MKARAATYHRQRGLSIVEILVGVLIGLIGILIIFQSFNAAEERKRTTGAGTDAQVTGAIALHTLERDVRPAGYGFGMAPLMGCTVNAYDSARPGAAFSFMLAPVRITQGAGGMPDTLTTLSGNSALFVATQTFNASGATTKRTQGRGGLLTGDLVVATGSGPVCALVEITGNTNADGVTIDHASGAYVDPAGNGVTSRYNAPAGPVVAFTSGNLYNLGNVHTADVPRRNIWSIRNNRVLTVVNDLRYIDANADGQNDWLEIADGVIDLQAEYGVDADGDNRISSGEWTTADPADWTRVRAVRVALLLRSGQYERAAATTTAPAWAGGTFVMRNVDGTADSSPDNDNDWRHYRYRVYQNVIPLRNMIWGTAP